MKICIDCNAEKNDSEFYTYELSKIKGRCKECLRLRSRNYANANKTKKAESDRRYRENNKEALKASKKVYVENNLEEVKLRQQNWYLSNRDEILEDRKEYRETHKNERNAHERDRRENDPVYRLRTNMSKLINHQMKKFSSSKDGSITQYLPYTIDELKRHLEKQFEPWMTWDNYGKYNAKTWDDNMPATWTWNIDHIIPQSSLPYSSINNDNFKKCWSLDNLRPLSAKQNVLLGTKLSKKRGGK
jgi:hypothetical protein